MILSPASVINGFTDSVVMSKVSDNAVPDAPDANIPRAAENIPSN